MQIRGHKIRSVFDRYHIAWPVDVTNAMQAVEAASVTKGDTLDGEKMANEKTFTQYL